MTAKNKLSVKGYDEVRNKIFSKLLVLCVSILMPRLGAAQGGVNQSLKNPLQVALLHWYDADLTTTFDVGTHPYAEAFDGANIWVANLFSNNVTKLRASDGAVLGTFAVGTRPIGLAFDGANIWVANQSDNTVTKL